MSFDAALRGAKDSVRLASQGFASLRPGLLSCSPSGRLTAVPSFRKANRIRKQKSNLIAVGKGLRCACISRILSLSPGKRRKGARRKHETYGSEG
jgi:hypothetical protein